mmetsp:Transcript_8467/g.26151  ORF Transcript_8467/g.26151 Transcript_8467/m.26151 type:complete len:279 (+) Transcript_8467:1010-1846(+)
MILSRRRALLSAVPWKPNQLPTGARQRPRRRPSATWPRPRQGSPRGPGMWPPSRMTRWGSCGNEQTRRSVGCTAHWLTQTAASPRRASLSQFARSRLLMPPPPRSTVRRGQRLGCLSWGESLPPSSSRRARRPPRPTVVHQSLRNSWTRSRASASVRAGLLARSWRPREPRSPRCGRQLRATARSERLPLRAWWSWRVRSSSCGARSTLRRGPRGTEGRRRCTAPSRGQFATRRRRWRPWRGASRRPRRARRWRRTALRQRSLRWTPWSTRLRRSIPM